MGPVSMEVDAKLPDQFTPLSVLFPATVRPEEQLRLKLRVKMDLLLNEHSLHLQRRAIGFPLRAVGVVTIVVAVRLYEKAGQESVWAW